MRSAIIAWIRKSWYLNRQVPVAGLFLLFAGSRLSAVPYLQEGFNYQPGILGTNAPWTGATSLISVTNVGMPYPYLMDFSPPANSVNLIAGSRSVTYRPLTTSATGGCVYFSFLINFADIPGSYYITGLTQSTNASPGGADDDPLDLVDGYYGTGYTLGVRAMGGPANYITNGFVGLNTNMPYLVVMKYNFTNGTASLYVNPPAGNTEPAIPDAISYATNSESVPNLSYVYLRVGSSTAGNFSISALRAASSWAEVTPATNAATAYSQAAMLTAFLDSLQVVNYWIEGFSVNWLTGATNGDSINMTEGTATHCSAFVGAVTDLLGIYILRQPQASDILLANNQANWLATNTDDWYPVDNMVDAQHMVNTGALAVASWLNPDPSQPGHIAVLRPSNRTDASIDTLGPEECQSGDNNYADTNISTGFATPGQFPSEIKYYYHAVTYPVSPVNPIFSNSTVSNRMFTTTIATIVGRKYQVQWSTNFTTWTPLLTFTNSDNSVNFYTNVVVKDPLAGGRFYRLFAW
jgi:hypothetical protein